MFTNKKKPPPHESLPPTKDPLYLHIERAHYEYQQWKKELDSHPHLVHLVGHGWKDIDGSLAVQSGILKPAPDSILEFVSYSKKSDKLTLMRPSMTMMILVPSVIVAKANCLTLMK